MHLKAASLTRAHTKDRQTAAVDKMVPFNTKIWFMHRLAVVHAGPKQSGMQPVISNSCALSNKRCIHKAGKALSRGSKLCKGNNQLLTFSEGGDGEKRLRGTSMIYRKVMCRRNIKIQGIKQTATELPLYPDCIS